MEYPLWGKGYSQIPVLITCMLIINVYADTGVNLSWKYMYRD
jgi:hypothetical protein